MRAERGQAAVDYLAVVLVVAAVLAAAVVLAGSTGLGERVVAAFKRALCVVSGQACSPAERAAALPCVLAADGRSEGGAITVAMIRVGERDGVLRELRADGTVALTLIDEDSIGLSVGTPSAHVRWGSFEGAIGRELRAAVLAERGAGKTWIARDAAEADRMVRRLQVANTDMGRRAGITAPRPDVEYRERGSSAGFTGGARGQGLELSSDAVYGERIDHARGWRTVYLRDVTSGAATLSFGEAVEGSGAIAAEERVAVTFDRRGRPIDLMVLAAFDVEGAATLPPALARGAGELGIPLRGERHVETERHLDLTLPANADAARLFLSGLAGNPAGLRLAAGPLRERLESASLAVRSYARGGDERGAGADARLLGMEVGSEQHWARLTGAARGGPGGLLVRDAECAPA